MDPPRGNARRAAGADGRLANLPPAARVSAAAPRDVPARRARHDHLRRHGCGLGRVRALLPRRHLRRRATRAWSGWCRPRSSGCSCCAGSAISCRPTARDYVGRHIVKTLRAEIFDRYLHLPVSFFDSQASGTLLSRLTYNTEQVAQATTDSITVFIRDTLTIARSRRLPVLHELAADAVQPDRRPADRGTDSPDQPPVPALQRADPGLDGRRHAGCEGGDRGAARGPRVQRPGSPGAGLRHGDRAQPALAHEDDAHPGAQQSGGAAGRRRSASPACCTSRRSTRCRAG